MKINSIGRKSELVFLNFDGKVEYRNNYVVMRSLTSPNYFWRNLLMYKTLVMCADPDYYALKIYESVGFKKQQLEYGVYWWDKNRN